MIALFQFDHIVLHAMEGEDRWWNLDPLEIAPHREKSRHDTSIVAKAKRIAKRETAHLQVMVDKLTDDYTRDRKFVVRRKRKIPSRVNPWPKGRKLRSRPWR